MKLKPFLIVLEILLTFLLTIVVDRGVGFYFKKSGYFKAMVPNLAQNYKSSEYEFAAKTSSQGIRNQEVGRKQKNTLRVLAIGDSFTWGWGVDAEQSWPKVLERKLKDAGLAVEVINAGIPGGDLKTEFDVCRRYADLFDVQMIVVGLYGSDDLVQNLAQVETLDRYRSSQKIWDRMTALFWPNLIRFKEKRYVVDPGPGETPGATVNISDVWKNMANSYLAQNPNVLINVSERVKEDFVSANVSPHLVIQSTIDPDYLVHVLDSNLMSSFLGATDRLLGDLKNCAKDKKVFLVFLPSEEMISDTYQNFREELGYKVDLKLLDLDMDSLLSPIVVKNGYSYISMLSDFRADGCGECYFPYDTHLTPIGHERVAEYIRSKI